MLINTEATANLAQQFCVCVCVSVCVSIAVCFGECVMYCMCCVLSERFA